MSKNPKEELPLIHLSKKEGQRKFEGEVLKKDDDYSLILPDRQFFVQLVKFAPGKGPKDWVAFHKPMNERRHEMDIHEVATFLTWGEHDMVVIWDAPDVKTYNRFLSSWINPNSDAIFTGDHRVVAGAMKHY